MGVSIDFDEHTLLQAVAVLKAKIRAKVFETPLVVELANGSYEGWKQAAREYLIARKELKPYNPTTLAQVYWEQEAGDEEERERNRARGA